MTISHEPIKQK